MLTIRESGGRLCDGFTRRDVLGAGGLGLLGLGLPDLLRARATAAAPSARARSCIVLFLMGGPPQHSTWDPKPDAPAEVRGQFSPIATSVPGIRYASLMPRLASQADKLAVLRAVSTDDNAHSSSGYYMLTGVPHAPKNVENANPGAPNNWPTLGALVTRARGTTRALPTAIRLPQRIFNTDGSVWPGQDSGFLGRMADPWLLRCEPVAGNYRIPDIHLEADVPFSRLEGRHRLLDTLEDRLATVDRSGLLATHDVQTRQAFDLLRSTQARQAFDLDRESPTVRERYGRSPFGQSVLMARRLVEAGVGLVQVNWYRGPDEPSDNPCWDSHVNESQRLKDVLVPPTDQALAALLEDLSARGLLGETLVVCMAEFGRTPKFNARGGRDHWGHVFSVALAGGGIRGGQVYGASDASGAYPREGRVSPEDLTATMAYCLGLRPDMELQDGLGRPFPFSRGKVISALV